MNRIVEYPSSADHAGELPPDLNRLRRHEPVARVRLPDGRIAWLVTRHDHVRAVLGSEKFTRAIPGPARSAASGSESTIRTVNMDGRGHLELRALVSKPFTVRQVNSLGPQIQELTNGLLDAMEQAGPPADLVCHLAAPLPAITICRLLGLPAADHDALSQWCDRITTTGGHGPDQTAWQELAAYLERAVETKRTLISQGGAPDADVLSTLIHAHDSSASLSMPELIGLAIVVLAGGLETTQTAISAGLLRLLRNPDQMDKLRTNPQLLDSAIEELLRYQPIIDLNRVQMATEDIQLGDQLVPAGNLVQISINAANHDENAFPESTLFDITRQPNPHLAFGHGAHHCLGAALARLEMRTAFSTLFHRFPGLSLAVLPEDLRWRGGHVTLSLAELPVTW